MKTRKYFIVALALLLCVALLVGCSGTPSASPTPVAKADVRVGVINGPTGISMAQIVDDNRKGQAANNYDFEFAGAPDAIVGKVTAGEVDIACVPANVAATLYNKTQGKVQMAAIGGLGMLYVLEKGDTIHSVADLKGKTIVTMGKGSTPEYALNYILEQNGLAVGSDVTVEYKSENAEVGSLFTAGQADVVMLPEPFATIILGKNSGARVALDVNEAFEQATQKAGESSPIVMTGVVVNKQFAQDNPQAVASFIEEYKESISFVNSDPAAASKIVADHEIVPNADAAVIEKAIPGCNIAYIDGDTMKSNMNVYMNILLAANPQSIGGSLPGEDFYYMK